MAQGLSIGDLAKRTGLAVSAIRFYETHGIVAPLRNTGGHRRYDRADLRRLSFVMAAQTMGFSLATIAAHLQKLPAHAAPSQTDWSRIAKIFRKDIDDRIAALEEMRDKLDGCIGCGCLSLKACKIYNANDHVAAQGTGPQNLTKMHNKNQ